MKQMNENGRTFSVLIAPAAIPGGRPRTQRFPDTTPPQPYVVDFSRSGGHRFFHDGNGNRTIEPCPRHNRGCRVCSEE